LQLQRPRNKIKDSSIQAEKSQQQHQNAPKSTPPYKESRTKKARQKQLAKFNKTHKAKHKTAFNIKYRAQKEHAKCKPE